MWSIKCLLSGKFRNKSVRWPWIVGSFGILANETKKFTISTIKINVTENGLPYDSVPSSDGDQSVIENQPNLLLMRKCMWVRLSFCLTLILPRTSNHHHWYAYKWYQINGVHFLPINLFTFLLKLKWDSE